MTGSYEMTRMPIIPARYARIGNKVCIVSGRLLGHLLGHLLDHRSDLLFVDLHGGFLQKF